MYADFEKLMKARGLSLYRVAKDTGIPLTSLSDWKNGKSKEPKAERLRVLADYLGVPITELMGSDPDAAPADPLAGIVSRRLDDDDFRAVVADAVQLSPAMLRRLRTYVELMREGKL